MTSTATVHALRRRIAEMQPQRLDDRALPTPRELRDLLPGGALRAGCVYSVHGSWQLALALLSEASRGGAWCGVIGCESFGAEAAATLGIALDRCVLIPRPGPHALVLTGALCESLTLVVARLSGGVSAGEAERIAARLREHGSALIVLGPWARAESTLSVTGSRWRGLGAGHGSLEARELEVRSQDRRGVRQHRVGLQRGRLLASRPDRLGQLRAV